MHAECPCGCSAAVEATAVVCALCSSGFLGRRPPLGWVGVLVHGCWQAFRLRVAAAILVVGGRVAAAALGAALSVP